jgi:hypothetical protein
MFELMLGFRVTGPVPGNLGSVMKGAAATRTPAGIGPVCHHVCYTPEAPYPIGAA